MIIQSIELYKYSLPLNIPIVVKGNTLQTRDGIICVIKDETGTEGFGEIAPLEGLSEETLDDAIAQVQKIIAFLTSEETPNGLHKLNGLFEEWLGNLKLFPSVRFGIEMAILSLQANLQNQPIYSLISNNTHDGIHINGLLQGSKEEVAAQAQDLVNNGFRAMKLKVGGNLVEDIAKVEEINKVLDGKAILHVDANQSWSFEDALLFGKKIGCAALDYIEEPFKDLEKAHEFYNDTLIPIALDESLKEISFDDVKKIEGVDVIVLKPMIIGGLEKAHLIMEEAMKQGIDPIISSSFESSLGILALANIAGSLSRDINAGLDTTKWFKKDLLNPSLVVNRGKIDISQLELNRSTINFELLTKI